MDKRKQFKSFIRDADYDNETLNDINTHNLISQLFYTESDEKITSWQVKVRIIEIKHLVGLNKAVYCIVKIGNQIFRTKEKSIENLDLSNEDEVYFDL